MKGCVLFCTLGLMKRLVVFILVFVSVFSYAQDSAQASKPKSRRVYIGASFSADYCYRTLINNDGSSLSSTIVSMYNNIDKPKFGYTSGISVGYKLSKHISIESGVLYSNKGYQTAEMELTFGYMIDRRRGFVYPSSPPEGRGRIIYRYNYLDIPLRVNFVFGKKKLHIISSVGITTNLLVSATNTFVGKDVHGNIISSSSSNTTSSYNRVNLSPMVSCGIEYTINPRMFFRIEPTFRYGILKLSDTPVTQYLWNAGINVGYYFSL